MESGEREPRLTTAEANRVFYAQNAAGYDEYEFCTFGAEPQRRIAELLDRAIAAADEPSRVLDAGGGSGHVAMHLVRRGFDPLVVDISPEMAAAWERKARAAGHAPRTELSSLEEFFATDERTWDLIVFSSVLHHLENPIETLRAAARRLAPGGAVATIFDPTVATRARVAIRRADYLVWMLVHRPSALLARLRRVGRPAAGADGADVGTLAERHALGGIDDDRLVAAMRSDGLELVFHERTHHARFAAVRALARLLRARTDFALILRRPG